MPRDVGRRPRCVFNLATALSTPISSAPSTVTIRAMREGTHDVVRLPSDTPASAYAQLFAEPRSPNEIFSVTCTADEVSVIVPTRLNTLVGAQYQVESDWTVLKVSAAPPACCLALARTVCAVCRCKVIL